MNIFLNDDELEEIQPLGKSEDKAIVITPGNPVRDKTRQKISDDRKEIIANDLENLSTREVAAIHGISQATASNIGSGKNVDEDLRLRINAKKLNIEDMAIAKLMETLNILDPSQIEKERDKIQVISGLSQVVERMTGKAEDNKPIVHLHMYNPAQKKESDYEIIEA